MHAEGQLSKWFQFRLHLIWGANEPWKGQMGVALQGKSLPRPHFFWFCFIYLFIMTHFAETFACINVQAPRLPPPLSSMTQSHLMFTHCGQNISWKSVYIWCKIINARNWSFITGAVHQPQCKVEKKWFKIPTKCPHFLSIFQVRGHNFPSFG